MFGAVATLEFTSLQGAPVTGREQLASLSTEAAMSGKWAAIFSASGCGSKVVLEAKNLWTA